MVRAKRTIDSSAEKLGAIERERLLLRMPLSQKRVRLCAIRSAMMQQSRHVMALWAAAVEKFKAAWLKDHARKLKLRAKAKKKKPA